MMDKEYKEKLEMNTEHLTVRTTDTHFSGVAAHVTVAHNSPTTHRLARE